MATRHRDRIVTFNVVDGVLTRTVVFPNGRSYTHRCEQRVFETVAHVVHETPEQGEGTTLEIIARQENLPFSQVNVALEFMKHRELVEVRGRRCYPATADTHLDAMIEFTYMADVSH